MSHSTIVTSCVKSLQTSALKNGSPVCNGVNKLAIMKSKLRLYKKLNVGFLTGDSLSKVVLKNTEGKSNQCGMASICKDLTEGKGRAKIRILAN